MLMPLFRFTAVLLGFSPETATAATAPPPISAREPLAAEFSLERAVRSVDASALHWQETKKCGTCHTDFAHLWARPSLARVIPSPPEVRTFVEEMVRERWESKGPRWDAEVVMAAAALAMNDRDTTGKLHPLTRKALDRMVSLQRPDGGWEWLKCGWPPMESDDHYGATFAALGIAAAPEGYAATENGKRCLEGIRRYLRANPPPSLHHQAMVLWASLGVEGILDEKERMKILERLWALERPGGGWATAALLDGWKDHRRQDSEPQDLVTADGYATGLVIYLSRLSGAPASHPPLERGLRWLRANQRQSGRWFTRSPTKDSQHYLSNFGTVFAALALEACQGGEGGAPRPVRRKEPGMVGPEMLAALKKELIARHGEAERVRIDRGIDQAARLWRAEDGDAEAFASFAREGFIADPALLERTFERLERSFEELDGHLNEIGRELRRPSDLDLGPLIPIDRLLASHDPWAHQVEDLFAGKIGFTVLLNFPLSTLEERLREGARWSRRQWAEARLVQRFSKRVPAAVNQAITRASAEGDAYIAEYNLWMHHLLDEEGRRPFPSGLRLISHWNLRDEIRARYADREGLAKQRLIARAMERIITQTIPRAVINNPRLDWSPFTNAVAPAPRETIEAEAPPEAAGAGAPSSGKAAPDGQREPDTRYAHLLATFRAARQADPHSPTAPTLIARRFDEDRELGEARVRRLLEEVLASPLAPRVARLIEERLGRKLEPFDIWYAGFQPRGKYPEPELDSIVSRKYPSLPAFQGDLPRLLAALGFSPEKAAYLSERIAVDAARGAGHAYPAMRRGDKPRLRTRFEKGGMNYKGFNIAIHELGHNVEQVFSLYHVDHTLLAGVPNNSFTEALAFVFQGRDLELLGLEKPDRESERLRALNSFWMTYEISGPALVDMEIWRWMYDHPEASPAELREAVVATSRSVWNRYFAPVLGGRDVTLLGVYSHMVSLMMYLPDYPLGHLIAFQIEEHLKKGKRFGEEIERMASFGRVTPDLWMEHATGSPVSAGPLLRAADRALAGLLK